MSQVLQNSTCSIDDITLVMLFPILDCEETIPTQYFSSNHCGRKISAVADYLYYMVGLRGTGKADCIQYIL